MKKRDISYFVYHGRDCELFPKLKDAKKATAGWLHWCIIRRDWNKPEADQDRIVEQYDFTSDYFFRNGIAYLLKRRKENALQNEILKRERYRNNRITRTSNRAVGISD